jgi:hypothetical protein
VFHYCCVSTDNILKPEHVTVVESTATGANLSPHETVADESRGPIIDAPVVVASNVPVFNVGALAADAALEDFVTADEE